MQRVRRCREKGSSVCSTAAISSDISICWARVVIARNTGDNRLGSGVKYRPPARRCTPPNTMLQRAPCPCSQDGFLPWQKCNSSRLWLLWRTKLACRINVERKSLVICCAPKFTLVTCAFGSRQNFWNFYHRIFNLHLSGMKINGFKLWLIIYTQIYLQRIKTN